MEREPRFVAIFGVDQAGSALDLLELVEFAWHDCYREITPPDAVVEDILLMSGGTIEGLIAAARLAVTDWRDLRVAADARRPGSPDRIVEPALDVVEMRIADIRSGAYDVEPFSGQVVVLEEVGGERRLPIWIGAPEAMSMARLLHNMESPRPMAPHLMFEALRAVGARVTEVRIDRLAADTFYAVAVIEGPSGTAEVNARPSDALNAALLAHARVTARRHLLDAAVSDADGTFGALEESFPNTARDIAESVEFAAHAGLARRFTTDKA